MVTANLQVAVAEVDRNGQQSDHKSSPLTLSRNTSKMKYLHANWPTDRLCTRQLQESTKLRMPTHSTGCIGHVKEVDSGGEEDSGIGRRGESASDRALQWTRETKVSPVFASNYISPQSNYKNGFYLISGVRSNRSANSNEQSGIKNDTTPRSLPALRLPIVDLTCRVS
jgi:hypothetical protein